MHRVTLDRIINAILFQCCWFGFVAGAAHGSAWWGLPPFALLAWHALRQAATRRSDFMLAGVALLLGLALDGSFANSAALVYADSRVSLLGAPWWILAMWVVFAWTLNHSLSWLRNHPGIAVLLGAIAGPVSYYVAGRAWGALEFARDVPTTLVLLGITWGIATGLLVWVTRKFATPTQTAGAPA